MNKASVTDFWRKNWAIVLVSSIAALILVLFFAPLATVPVRALESYYITQTRTAPVSETVLVRESQTEPVTREQAFYADYLVAVQWDQYAVLPLNCDLKGKINPLIYGNFASLDKMGVHFLVLDLYNYRLYYSAFTPTAIYDSRSGSGNFAFTPASSQYYLIFDNDGYSFLRYFKLNASFAWAENVTSYKEIPVTKTSYQEIPVQVERQHEIIKYEKRSLFQLISG